MVSKYHNHPTVTVVVPVYNVAQYVERCVLSVMNQSYPAVECLIVDDGTEDDSIERCERLIEGYTGMTKFRIFHHEKNRGLSAARNTGIIGAKGEFLYFLDSDDYIPDNCLEKLVKVVIDNPSVELVQGGTTWDTTRPAKILVSEEPNTNEEVRACFYSGRMNVYAWNKLIGRDFIIRNKLYFCEGILFEDAIWIFFLLKYLNCVRFVDEVKYHYSSRPDSIMKGTDFDVKVSNWKKGYRIILNNLTPGKEKEELEYHAPRAVLHTVGSRDIYELCQHRVKEHSCGEWLKFELYVIRFLATHGWTQSLLNKILSTRIKSQKLIKKLMTK